ncbi:CBM20 domain-containing protein [Spirosoma gilvum]
MLSLYVTPPGHHLATEPIFLAGTLNSWQPGDDRFRLTYDEALQMFVIQLPTSGEGIEYKFTRGAWSSEEVDLYGNPINNRV